MYYRRHQPKHAARTLKLNKRRPIAVEPVEDLRMDRVGRFDSLLILRIFALGRELRLLRPVQVGECSGNHIAVLELSRICQWLKQSPPHDLESFLCARWSPRRLHATDDIT